MKYKSLLERLACNIFIDPVTGCWIWLRRLNNFGYPVMSVWENGRSVKKYAHRTCYELFNGPIPDGLELDHKCVDTRCICPDHTHPVTGDENIRLRDERNSKYLAQQT